MSVPIQQAVRIGSYVLKQHITGRKRYPLVLMLEPLFRCNLACAGCGKIDYPDRDPEPAHLGRRRAVRCRGMRRAGGLDRRRRAAPAQGAAADRRRPDQAEALRLSLHQCAAAREEDASLQAEHVLHLVGASRRRQGIPRQGRSVRTASTRRRSRRSRRRRPPASASTSTAPSSTAPSPNAPPRSSTT